jgi:AraC family transcriptional regulator, arabinose operon regulatory protein
VKALDPRIKLAVEIMEHELNQPLLVSDISARLRLSESRFEHLFKVETGKTFKIRLRESRLEKARYLLMDPTWSIKEVATAVGYNFTPNFTLDFRKRFGKPPSRYRSPSA